jgi:hypothetical protein
VQSDGRGQRELQRAALGARRYAEVAELAASRLLDLAATYRQLADGARSTETTTRLLSHASRLEDRADRERSEAAQLRQMVSRANGGTRAAAR